MRVLRRGRVTGRDTIVELVPDRRFSYTHASSLPVRDYRGEVDLGPSPGGTEIRWVTRSPEAPGHGRADAPRPGRVHRGVTEGLAARATKAAGGRGRAAA